MTRQQIVPAVTAMFGCTAEDLRNHRLRGEDVMDARSAVAWILHDRFGYSGRRSAQALGYKDSTLTQSWDRLRLRFYASPRLRAQVEILFPSAEKGRAA